MGPTTTNTTYRQHHIHTLRLLSGVWVASVVTPGGSVEHLRGDFATHEDALHHAEQTIDEKTPEDTEKPSDQSRPTTSPPLPMWQTMRHNCTWTSGTRTHKDEANALGKFHEQDNLGHAVNMTETTTRKATKPFGNSM